MARLQAPAWLRTIWSVICHDSRGRWDARMCRRSDRAARPPSPTLTLCRSRRRRGAVPSRRATSSARLTARAEDATATASADPAIIVRWLFRSNTCHNRWAQVAPTGTDSPTTTTRAVQSWTRGTACPASCTDRGRAQAECPSGATTRWTGTPWWTGSGNTWCETRATARSTASTWVPATSAGSGRWTGLCTWGMTPRSHIVIVKQLSTTHIGTRVTLTGECTPVWATPWAPTPDISKVETVLLWNSRPGSTNSRPSTATSSANWTPPLRSSAQVCTALRPSGAPNSRRRGRSARKRPPNTPWSTTSSRFCAPRIRSAVVLRSCMTTADDHRWPLVVTSRLFSAFILISVESRLRMAFDFSLFDTWKQFFTRDERNLFWSVIRVKTIGEYLFCYS